VFSRVSQFKTQAPLAFGFFDGAKALWRGRELLWQFTLRNVELRHKGSHLGLIWSVINPLLMMSLYVFVFGYIFKGSFHAIPNETKVDYALGIFLGLTIFHFIAEVLSLSPTLIVSNPNFVKKVVFPLELLPAASVGSAAFHMLISLSLVLIGAATIGPGLTSDLLWLPIILFPLIPLALGAAWLFAAIGVFFRDINQLVTFLSMVLMYASALFYSQTILPPAAWAILRFNPLLLAVELARNAVLWHRPIDLLHLGYVYCFSLIACVIGYGLFRRMAPAFADVL
jgi:lipopolysaccharide transport system permease protein